MRDFQHPLHQLLDGNVFQESKEDLQGADSLHKVRHCLELIVFFGSKIVEYKYVVSAFSFRFIVSPTKTLQLYPLIIF